MKTTIFLAALLAGAMSAPAMAGTWKYERDQQDHSILAYREDGKATFFLGCGHAFVLHVKYPGAARKEGTASIVLASGDKNMTLKGEFEEPFEDIAGNFRHADLGYSRQDPELYGKTWEALRDRLLDLLNSGKPLTISAGKASYTLPAIDATGWRKPLGECG